MAMESPIKLSAHAVRDEKVKVLRAIRPITPPEMHDYLVRGQYGAGTLDGQAVPGYREEPDVAPESGTATYAVARFMVENWRWQDVQFYLRLGILMPHRSTELELSYQQPPHIS